MRLPGLAPVLAAGPAGADWRHAGARFGPLEIIEPDAEPPSIGLLRLAGQPVPGPDGRQRELSQAAIEVAAGRVLAVIAHAGR